MDKNYTSGHSFLGNKIFSFSKVAFISALILSLGGFFIIGTALAEHTTSVSVSPSPGYVDSATGISYVKGNQESTYTFTVTNNGNDPVYKITINIPTDSSFSIDVNTISCPSGWTKDSSSNSSQAICITDPFGGSVLTSNNNVEVSFSATSPALENDIQYNWIAITKDRNGGYEYINTEAKTTVDVTAPTTQAKGVPGDWVNSDVTVTLACDDGNIGSRCKETRYQICDENGKNCGSEQTGNNVSLTCSEGSVCKYTVKYYSVDNVDNTEGTTTSGVIKIDKKAPETSATVGTPQYKPEGTSTYYITSLTQITLSAEDEGSGVQTIYYKIDEGSEQIYSESSPITISDEGPHTITYWSVDNVGNVEGAKTLSIYVDNSGPTIENIQIKPSYSDGTNLYISGTSTISASVTDVGSGVASCEYTLDGGANWNSATYDSENNICKVEGVDTSDATSIKFRATDNLRNPNESAFVSVTPDTQAPTISNIQISPESPSNDNTPTITFDISDDKSRVKTDSIQISEGGNTYTPECSNGHCTYTFTSALNDGTYTFTISASDNVGNSASAKIEGYLIDTQKPTTSDNTPTDWQNSKVTITLTPSDPEPSSGLEWTRYCTDANNTCDPASGTDYDPNNKPQISTEGITYFRYASKDKAGNVQGTVSREIKIDKTAPTVSVLGWEGDSWTNATKTASVGCQDQEGLSGCNQASYKLYISDSQITSCPTDPNQYTSSDNFQITSHSWVCAYAEDNAGNGAVSSPVEFMVDQISPDAQLTGVPTDWQNENATIELSCSDEGGSKCSETMYYGLADTQENCNPTQEYAGLITVSSHKWFCYKVSDNAGNETTGSVEIKVDKDEPTTEIVSPAESSWHNSDFEVSISDSDTGGSGLDKCYYRVKALNGNDWIYTVGDQDNWVERNCNSSITLTVGENKNCPYQGKDVCRIQVKAVDRAGNDNWGTPWNNRDFSIDWTAPQTTLIVVPSNPDGNNSWYKTSPTITLTCNDNASGCDKIYYKWDDGDYNEYTNQIIAPEGTHTLFYYSIDKAGNSETPQTKEFKVDTQAPTVTVNSLITNDNTPELTGTVDDRTATVEVTVAGKTYSATVSETPNNEGTYNWTANVTDELNDGVYDVSVKATDQAGNVGYDTTQDELTIDTQPPTITNFEEPKTDKVYKGNVPLKFTPDGTGSAVSCAYKIDDGNLISVDCNSRKEVNTTITGLSDGRHSLVLVLTDAAGNSTTIDPISFVVDLDNTLTVGPSGSGADFTSIQKAIGEATEGDTIEVAAGTYDEQIVIDKALTIQGQGNETIIKPSQTTANNFQLFSRKAGGSDNTAPIVVANADVTIKNLKIDGSEVSSVPSGATFVGILYRGVNGTIDSVTVEGINITDGNAIYLSSMGNEVEIEVSRCTIRNFYKNGITANYSGLAVNIHHNTIIGSGLRADVAQNGIQIGFDATGSVTENTVSDIAYTGEDYEATGILFVDSSGNARNNIVTNCQTGIVAQAWGSETYNVTIENNTINATGLTGLFYIAGTGAATWNENATINITINNNNLTGAGYGEGISIGGEPQYNPAGIINATIEGNSISNWGHGIWLGPTSNQISIIHNNITNNVEVDSGIHITGVDVSGIKINFNKIEGNASYGVYNGGTGILDATNNWWGDVSGPYNESTNIGGKGNAVSDNVEYRPWCSDENCSVEDSIAPTVVSHTPANYASRVNPMTEITIIFSEDVQCNAENGDWSKCIVIDPAVSGGEVNYDSNSYTLIFTPPESGLESNTEYSVSLVNVEDKSGNFLYGIETGTQYSWEFTTANHYSIPLYPDWNLISIPTVPVDTSIEAVLGNATSAIESVWTYDAVNGQWYVYHPNSPETSNLTSMNVGYGYWIKALEKAVIEGYGSLFNEQQVPPQRTLAAGWNLIGYYQRENVTDIPAICALSTLCDNYCDPATRHWTTLVTYDNLTKRFINVNWYDEMIPGNGYWIFMKSSAIGTYMYGPGETAEECWNCWWWNLP